MGFKPGEWARKKSVLLDIRYSNSLGIKEFFVHLIETATYNTKTVQNSPVGRQLGVPGDSGVLQDSSG